jgi:UDP-4-amino-4,6-dideoxy-N-acetyl-beta-L-altrosamine N-acetyltransferase
MYSLRFLEEKDLRLVFEWRNSERIRNSMFHDNLITYNEHEKWFHKIKQSDSDCYLLFLIKNIPTGLVCFNQIDPFTNVCEWGFYIGSLDAPKGSGTIMCYLGINYAFANLPIHVIYGEVFAYNISSLSLHERLGFLKEKEFHKEVEKQGANVEVFRYSIENGDWNRKKEFLRNEFKKRGLDF